MALLGSFHNYGKIIFLVIDCPRFFEIQKAFPASTHINRYKGLFSEERWLFLSHMCRFDILRLHSLGEISVFERTLEAGLAAMKTHQCFDEKTTKDACPVCSDKLNSVAHRLPFAHCTQSRLICSYTGDEMNEENEPLMLPNGHIYGRKAINILTDNDYIKCPRTKERHSSHCIVLYMC